MNIGKKIEKKGVVYELGKLGWTVVEIMLTNASLVQFENEILNEKVTSIMNELIVPESIEVIILGDYMNNIQSNALINSSAETIYLGNHTENIDFLYTCNAIDKVLADSNNKFYRNIGENLYTKDGKILVWGVNEEIDEGATEIGINAFKNRVLGTVELKSVKAISCTAFNRCKIDKVIVGSSVSTVSLMAFNHCAIGEFDFKERESVLFVQGNGINRCHIMTLSICENVKFDRESLYDTSVKSLLIYGGTFHDKCFSLKTEELESIFIYKSKCIVYSRDEHTSKTVCDLFDYSLNFLFSLCDDIVNLCKDNNTWIERVYW